MNTNEPAIELELTYLAREIPKEIGSVTPTRLVDAYVPDDMTIHAHLRLRRNGEVYEATKKVPLNEGDASAQTEYTIPLDQTEFQALSSVSQRRIEKDRYKVVINGHVAEVDVFRGLLEGLVVIDFEFDSEDEKATFEAPDCCLVDVTQEDFIAGGNLAGRSYDDIVHELDRFNYVRLS